MCQASARPCWLARWPSAWTPISGDPVHAGPAAQRHHGRQHLQPGDANSSSCPVPHSPTSCFADEINRATPRASRRCWNAWASARSPSTVRRGRCYAPFLVLATQNPIEFEGTFPLPEAQLDRFSSGEHRLPGAGRRRSHAPGPRQTPSYRSAERYRRRQRDSATGGGDLECAWTTPCANISWR